MSAIQNLSEPWAGHFFKEIEEFVTSEIDSLDSDIAEIKSMIMRETPLTFEAAGDDVRIYFNCYISTEQTRTIEVSTDGGATWNTFVSEDYDDANNTPIAVLSSGQTAIVRGNNQSIGYFSGEAGDPVSGGSFRIEGDCYVYGNIMSLLNREDFAAMNTVPEYCFTYLFSDYDGNWENRGLLSHQFKRLLLTATILAESCYSNMFVNCISLRITPELHATTLAEHCCQSMFNGCTGLTTATALPATTMVRYCYSSMFYGCTSLTTAPVLPATTLANFCYYHMFDGCTSLTTAPALPATTLAENCYAHMFSDCTSLTTAPALPATTIVRYCYFHMFDGCTSLTTAPALPATTLVGACYSNMFNGCVSLTTAPVLPATTLAEGCYDYMFNGCTSLNYVKAMFTTTPGIGYTPHWLDGVSPTGTFVKNASATWSVSGANGIPTGWTVETADN